ncbi:hypothetical protein PROFUN_02099 [Planoprotostelium fungivorum]|uniref:Uncharacterized protein n=1 Tax=Planoprotostelium fungivorum TaxID=1890364 RepID=A0A2P6NZ38_9EUKA|nr:hypothetical protein PROFUN_02099 [Planoprotostelium fungivorum]
MGLKFSRSVAKAHNNRSTKEMRASLFLLGLVGSCLSQTIVVTPTWNVSQTQLNIFTGGLTKYIFDNYMYHWGPILPSLRWDTQGFVDQEEIDYLIKNGNGMAAGGGYYISEDKYDSEYFGPWPTTVVIPAGTLRYSNVWAAMVFGKMPNDEEKAYLGRIVPFIDEYFIFGDWRVVHSAKLLQQVMAATRAPEKYRIPMDKVRLPTDYQSLHLVGAPAKFSGTKEWKDVRRHWALLDYVSPWAKCAVLLHPEDPFSIVDAAKFDRYVETLINVVDPLVPGEYGSRSLNRSTAAVLTQKLFSGITGKGKSDPSVIFRRTPLRSGSAATNYTVDVSPHQLYSLRSNAYITVENVQVLNENRTRVSFWYPDALHNSQLLDAQYMSYDMIRKIRSFQSEIPTNQTLREELTAEMLADIFYTAITSYSIRDVQNLFNIQAFSEESDVITNLYPLLFSRSLRYDMVPAQLALYLPPIADTLGGMRQLQWKQYIHKMFNGPKPDDLTATWNEVDRALMNELSDWKEDYTKTFSDEFSGCSLRVNIFVCYSLSHLTCPHIQIDLEDISLTGLTSEPPLPLISSSHRHRITRPADDMISGFRSIHNHNTTHNTTIMNPSTYITITLLGFSTLFMAREAINFCQEASSSQYIDINSHGGMPQLTGLI